MPLRIMHVVNNLGKGGLENGLVNLIQGMDPHRFEHVVCTIRGLGPNADRLPHDRVQLACLADEGSNSSFQTPALVRAIRRFQPDIVHSRNWAGIEGVIAARLARARAVVHSEHGFEAKASESEPRRRTWFRRVAYELADRVLAVSFQLRDVHSGRTGFPLDKISVIHNGVDRLRFFPSPQTRARVREELGLAPAEFCIGCVANLLPVKDHLTLLKSLQALSPVGPDWRLVLVGDGSERPRLEAFVHAQPQLRPRVQFLGSSGRVAELLQALDVFVLPSVAEGICNSLLEAMATGVPAIATSVGGNPEIIVDGESGLLFPSGNPGALAQHLGHLRAQPALRLQMGQRAIQRVRDEFSMQSMIEAYEELYLGLRSAAGVPAVSVG